MVKKKKYGNHKIVNRFGEFDSTLEWDRFVFLSNRQKEGIISNLRRQVEYELIPTQYKSVEVQLKTKTKIVEKVAEQPCSYRADFVYERGGETIVEDCKGAKDVITADFKIKKKLMLWLHKIEVQIVTSATEWKK